MRDSVQSVRAGPRFNSISVEANVIITMDVRYLYVRFGAIHLRALSIYHGDQMFFLVIFLYSVFSNYHQLFGVLQDI